MMFITKNRHDVEIAEYAADLTRANEARDNWKASSKEWEAKFKKAISDLAAQSDEIAVFDAAFPADALAIIDVMTDHTARPAEQVAADASEESGLTILPARVSAVRKALHALGLAGFGALYDDDSTHIVGRGYWLTKSGVALQSLMRARRNARKGAV